MPSIGQQSHAHFIPTGLSRVSASFIYRYNVVGRISLSRIYRYIIQSRVTLSRIYRYSILARTSLSRIYLYNIAGRISLSRIYRYGILGRTSLSQIYRYGILGRASLSRIYLYNIIERISLSRIYRYNVGGEQVTPPTISTGGGRRRKQQRRWFALMSRISQRLVAPFIRIPAPEKKTIEVEEIEPEEIVALTRVSASFTYRYSIEAPKLKSIVASVVPPRPKPIYPLIINPITSPIIQKTVTFPPSNAIKQPVIPFYRVGEGRHIESQAIPITVPKRKGKAASIVMKLLILSEIERQLG